MNKKIIVLLLIIVLHSHSQLISEVDFILGATYTGSYLWENFIGLSVQFQNVQDLMNSTLFQGYQMNSNIKGNWANNWGVSLKTPLGHKYNCSALAANITNPNVTCTFQTQENTTYWSVLGEYIWNSVNQPFWCIGYDMQGVNLTLTSHQDVLYNWLFKVYQSTHNMLFCAELVDYGDKMVQRGYKSVYAPADFIKDIEKANYVVYSVMHSGPGITQDASTEWMLSIQNFTQVSYMGHFTVRCIVFKNISQVTIQNILSDNATKYYLRDRFAINDTYAYSDFSSMYLGINDIRLTTGEGVDGVTNTFAAALWALDMIMEFCLMNGWQIDFNHQIRAGNFQSFLGPAPDLKPRPIYYGLLFASLVRDGSPQIVVPSARSFISSKIKAFGYTTGQIFKILLINKDTNVSLKGNVLIKSELTGNLNCITLEAPSLTSTDGVTIAGYNLIGNDSSLKGTYKQIKIEYSYSAEGYQIPIKYAQAILCETSDSMFNWPKGTVKSFQNSIIYSAFFGLIVLILTFSL